MGRPPKPKQPCTNDWCDRLQHARGYCHACYQRGWSTGDMGRAATVHREWDLSRVDVDEAAVQRLMAGNPPERTTLGDREEAVRRLHSFGLNDREIAERMHRRVLYVWRVRDRLGLPANQRGHARRGNVYFTDHLARARLKAIQSRKAS
jgi:hypothetical protein